MSIPEGIMKDILEQLEINFTQEVSFPWSNKKRYDFYLPEYNCIIETHGNQHYIGGFYQTLEEIQENDIIKEELALNNGIKFYIIIDCKQSYLEYIKKSILSSKLNIILQKNLNKINWDKCYNDIILRSDKELYKEYNNNPNVYELCEKFDISEDYLRKKLKEGNRLGQCDYKYYQQQSILEINPEKNIIREYINLAEASYTTKISKDTILNSLQNKQLLLNGSIWIYTYQLYKSEAVKEFQDNKILQLNNKYEVINKFKNTTIASETLKIPTKCISNCSNDNCQYIDGTFFIKTKDYCKNKILKDLYKNYNFKKIIQLDKDNNKIAEYYKIADIIQSYNIHTGHISECLKGKRKTAGGYKWLYANQIYESEIIKRIIYQKIKTCKINKKLFIQYDLKYNKIRTCWGVNNIEKECNICKGGISKCLKGEHISAGGFIFELENINFNYNNKQTKPNNRSKIIEQHTLDTNKKIAEYNSIREASIKTGISEKKISACVNGRQNSTHGYVFKLKENSITNKTTYNNKNKIITQYDLYGNKIDTYNSVNEAVRKTGYSRSCISDCINGKQYSTHGYFFKEIKIKTIIVQLDMDGNEINSYTDVKEASIETKINIKNIFKCLNNIRETAGGYKWEKKTIYEEPDIKFLKEGEVPLTMQRNGYTKRIGQVDVKTNEIIKIYDSVADAGKTLDTAPANISKCLTGKQKTAKGYGWVYV